MPDPVRDKHPKGKYRQGGRKETTYDHGLLGNPLSEELL